MGEIISVIVPVYNVEEQLEKCIWSIIKQTYNNLEIILIDDGSTDNSGIICDRFAKRDSRICVVHKKNGGLADAKNEGLGICNGKYIGFVDSDDWIARDMYEFLYRKMKEEEADIVVCGHYMEDESGNIYDAGDGQELKKVYSQREGVAAVVRDKELHSLSWDKLYKKELFDNIEFPSGRYMEDIFTTYQVFMNAKKTVKYNEPKYYYFQRNTSILHTRGEKLNWDQFCAYKEMREKLKKDYPELEETITVRLAEYGYSVYCWFLKQRDLSRKELEHQQIIQETLQECRKEIERKKYGDWKIKIRLFLAGKKWYPFLYRVIKQGEKR